MGDMEKIINLSEAALKMKALSDPNRLMIAEMLTDGEKCACKLLERFNISQPTLSHHMKILCGAGLVQARKEGKWMHYSLNSAALTTLAAYIDTLASQTANTDSATQK